MHIDNVSWLINFNTIQYPQSQILYGKYMEAIVFVHSCEKPQDFPLTERNNFR